MDQLTLNHALILTCPDGFHEMDGEERSKLNFLEEGEGVCLSDPERHIIVTVGWKRTGGIVSFLLNDKDLAKNMEARLRKPMRPYGYKLEGFAAQQVGGREAQGVRYRYQVGDVGMYGESLVLKSGRTLYYFHFYAREALKAESVPIWRELLDQLRWLNA